MSVELVLGIAGCLVTVMVIAGMVLLTPRNVEDGARATAEVDPFEPAPRRRAPEPDPA